MGNRLPSTGTKKNTIVPSNIPDDTTTTNQIKGRNELQRQHTISERSDQKEHNNNILYTTNIDNNTPPTILLMDGSSSSLRRIPSTHSSKNSSRRSSSRSRLNLSTRTPALSFKQHPSSRISIESSEDIINNYQMSMEISRSQRAKEMMHNVDFGYDEMSHKMSARSEMTSASSKVNLTSPIPSTIHSTVNTARRDIITGIITIPASSLSSQNIHLAHENMISDLFADAPTSADCSPRSSFSAKDSPKRPIALPAHLYAIKDNSDHDVDGVSKTLDDEGDYFVGGDLLNPIFM